MSGLPCSLRWGSFARLSQDLLPDRFGQPHTVSTEVFQRHPNRRNDSGVAGINQQAEGAGLWRRESKATH